jgi:hypothetical protein
MQEQIIWDRLITYWGSSGRPVRPGASSEAFQAFQHKYGVAIPTDFMAYIQAVDGTGEYQSDNSMNTFLPLDAIRPVHEVLDDSRGVIYAERFAYPDCYVFADHFLNSWFYAIHMTSDPASPGPVYRVLADDRPGEMLAGSFRQFISLYLENPNNIL